MPLCARRRSRRANAHPRAPHPLQTPPLPRSPPPRRPPAPPSPLVLSCLSLCPVTSQSPLSSRPLLHCFSSTPVPPPTCFLCRDPHAHRGMGVDAISTTGSISQSRVPGLLRFRPRRRGGVRAQSMCLPAGPDVRRTLRGLVSLLPDEPATPHGAALAVTADVPRPGRGCSRFGRAARRRRRRWRCGPVDRCAGSCVGGPRRHEGQRPGRQRTRRADSSCRVA